MNKKFAIACADGMGDALITSIAAHHLRKQGHLATVFNSHLPKFGKYLEPGEYLSNHQHWKETLKPFDAILLQYEDTPRAREILSLRKEGFIIYVIYTNYRFSKHGALTPFDYPVDEQKPMVSNVQQALLKLFQIEASTQNCLLPTLNLSHRKYTQRILIHPMSANPEKNWHSKKFLKLAGALEKQGFEVLFILSPEERNSWPKEIHAPLFSTLETLAETMYESGFFIGNDSGPAHLASYYQIPHIVIAQGRQMPLWSSGWRSPILVLPPSWIPNIKWLRFREQRWQNCITAGSVLRAFAKAISN